ncbi:sugar dehydrogenase complex small subunit [Primorskyibacter flagellatus]|uniref:Membrane bound FAD containing D-sorbitol dehydrogenase n=1 Tax=Primorskyibacter flagellatus TaxID=1387277 RepID=A0A1W1YXC2_9RHOB|nr:sugar dehydrogenase complex small subunit [Primorskyibacter flagellatus]SMC40348.1 Membrane bound FAD containing D-sorbitol dehydrogenase [Primorskyibacter flagellatus]
MPPANPKASNTVTRRTLLSAVSAMSVLSLSQWPGRAFAADLDVDAFLALSQKLTQQDDLSADIAADMLAAFSATGQAEDLAVLAEDENDEALANAVVASWYTGVSPDQDDFQVVTYTDALIWQAMDYTKPMAYCGGEVGYWADPPSA